MFPCGAPAKLTWRLRAEQRHGGDLRRARGVVSRSDASGGFLGGRPGPAGGGTGDGCQGERCWLWLSCVAVAALRLGSVSSQSTSKGFPIDPCKADTPKGSVTPGCLCLSSRNWPWVPSPSPRPLCPGIPAPGLSEGHQGGPSPSCLAQQGSHPCGMDTTVLSTTQGGCSPPSPPARAAGGSPFPFAICSPLSRCLHQP